MRENFFLNKPNVNFRIIKTGKNAGFTLIEMIIVIAIMAIISAIAVPNYITHRNNQKVTQAARQIYSALQSAKMTAIRNNTSINVLFSTGAGSSGTYQVFEDLDDNNTFNAGDEDIASGQMPAGVNMQTAAFAGAANSTRFTPMGLTTGENGTVTVTNSSRTARIIVNSVGGIRVD